MKNLICWWKGHFYNTSKYRYDLERFWLAYRDLLFRSKKEIEDYYDNPPLPYCFRCKKEIII